MSAEGPHRPSATEQEQIDAMSSEHKKMSENRESHILVDEDEIRQSIELPLRETEGNLSSIEVTLKSFEDSKMDLSGKDRSPRITENIKESRRIVSEVRQKLAELEDLFKTT